MALYNKFKVEDADDARNACESITDLLEKYETEIKDLTTRCEEQDAEITQLEERVGSLERELEEAQKGDES